MTVAQNIFKIALILIAFFVLSACGNATRLINGKGVAKATVPATEAPKSNADANAVTPANGVVTENDPANTTPPATEPKGEKPRDLPALKLAQWSTTKIASNQECTAVAKPTQFELTQDFKVGNAFMMFSTAIATKQGGDVVRQTALQWGFGKTDVFSNPTSGLDGFIMSNSEMAVLAFRASQETGDWLSNAAVATIPAGKVGLNGWVHSGFANAASSEWDKIVAAVKAHTENFKPLYITGHSLGGAMSALIGARLKKAGYNVSGIYAFGQPRVGDHTLAADLEATIGKVYFRVVYQGDVVTHVPAHSEARSEFGKLLPFGIVGQGLSAILSLAHYTHTTKFYNLTASTLSHEMARIDSAEDQQFWIGMQQKYNGATFLPAFGNAVQNFSEHKYESYLCGLAASLAKEQSQNVAAK